MTRRRRYSIIIGLVWVALAVGYFGLAPVLGYSPEWAGATMLVALGAAMGIMSYVLTSGSGD